MRDLKNEIKAMSNEELIKNHKKLSENGDTTYSQWMLDRELFDRVQSTHSLENLTTTSNTVDYLSAPLDNTFYHRIDLPMYRYTYSLGYTVVYKIYAKWQNRTYQVGEDIFLDHNIARSKLKGILKEKDHYRVELIAQRSGYQEYDYPKVKDIDRFFIRQETISNTTTINSEPNDWTYYQDLLTSVEDTSTFEGK